MLVPRVLVVSAVIAPAVALRLLPYLVPVAVAGAALTAISWQRRDGGDAAAVDLPRGSPLRLRVAIQMALAFQIAMLAIEFAQHRWALPGLYATAAFLGLTDVDALTVSMSRTPDGLTETLAARAIAVGILANTLFKSAMSAVLGDRRFSRFAAGGLLVMGSLGGIALWLL